MEFQATRVWAALVSHFGGVGLESGPPDLATARHAQQLFLETGRRQEAFRLESGACVGSAAALRAGRPCPTYGLAGATALHLYWACRGLYTAPGGEKWDPRNQEHEEVCDR